MISLKQKLLHFVDPWVNVPVAGLDISDRTIKYLGFKNQVKLESANFGEIELPEGVISRGEILQEDVLIKTLKTWLNREGKSFRGSAFAVSLPEEKGFLRLIQIPKIKKGEVLNAIRWEIETNVPLPLDQLAYDHEIVETENQLDHLDVLIIAFPKTVIESYLRVLKGSGLNPIVLEHEAQSIVRALIQEQKFRDTVIVLDFGHTRTRLIIVSGEEIIFTTTIELGGITLEENIERELKVDRIKAVELKKEVGLNKTSENGKIFAALAPVVSVLSDEVKKAMEYYRTHSHRLHSSSLDIKEIVLTGGDASLLGLDTYLAAILKLPVSEAYQTLASKLWMDHRQIPALPKNRLGSYTTAIGLAMKNWE